MKMEDEGCYQSLLSSLVEVFRQNLSCFRGAEMLNVPSQSFPAVSSQQRVASGSQPRNKVALKPGHSLMDWIRLTKSGCNLSGLNGRLIEVTEEELKKHNTRNDCWTCIRGMVYNVSPYMDYHPGGEEELMKAAGIDGTDLFDQVHRWVNYESMLKECLVGRMVVKVSTAIKAQPVKDDNTLVNGLGPPTTSQLDSAAPALKENRPRYDWFQTEETVNIVIYTKRKIPRSGCTVVDCQGNVLRIEVLFGRWSYLLHWSLCYEVEENVNVQTLNSVGKVEVCLRKVPKAKWAQVGQPLDSHDSFIQSKHRGLFYRDCVLASKREVTHDTQLFCFQLPPGAHMHIPVGRHVYLKASVQGNDVVKPYTPVDQVLMPQIHASTTLSSEICLMIKVYPDGVFTQHLDNLDIGASVSISGPEGSFTLRSLCDVTHLYLLAAGTGFTPMARLLCHVLQDLPSVSKTKLMFFNRQERDILWYSQLEQLCAEEERFQVEYILSEPADTWTGKRGRIDGTMLQTFLERPGDSKCLVCVCGPTGFTELAIQLVKQQGFSDNEIHVFKS